MPPPLHLPDSLGHAFSVTRALDHGLSIDQLRHPQLETPFHGTRLVRTTEASGLHPLERQLQRELLLIDALAQRLGPQQFFSHRSAALLWGAPMPALRTPELHASVHSPGRAPRVAGVVGHRVTPRRCPVILRNSVPLSSPAASWVMLGSLRMSVRDLVVAGDFLVRRHRDGFGRRHVGRAPLTSREELSTHLKLGRWRGLSQLTRALELIREDSWSPQESLLRLEVVGSGLPEPQLNLDVYDSCGKFLACIDLAYPEWKVGIEYHGLIHADRYAEDVERAAALRADGWIILEVTKVTVAAKSILIKRIGEALRQRGWRS